jgi:hypothetical protein
MRIEVYHAADWRDVPGGLYVEFDGIDDRCIAAFNKYAEPEMLVVAAWATTGEVAGDPMAALVATKSHIITGYIDTYFDVEPESDDGLFDDMLKEGETFEGFEPLVHDEPDCKRA